MKLSKTLQAYGIEDFEAGTLSIAERGEGVSQVLKYAKKYNIPVITNNLCAEFLSNYGIGDCIPEEILKILEKIESTLNEK
jgi:type III secretion system FlhB-like substrate exporter